MKKIMLLMVFCLLFLSCNDDETSAERIKRYESYLLGTWIPSSKGKPIKSGSIFKFENDGRGQLYTVKDLQGDVYTVITEGLLWNTVVVEEKFEIYKIKSTVTDESLNTIMILEMPIRDINNKAMTIINQEYIKVENINMKELE